MTPTTEMPAMLRAASDVFGDEQQPTRPSRRCAAREASASPIAATSTRSLRPARLATQTRRPTMSRRLADRYRARSALRDHGVLFSASRPSSPRSSWNSAPRWRAAVEKEWSKTDRAQRRRAKSRRRLRSPAGTPRHLAFLDAIGNDEDGERALTKALAAGASCPALTQATSWPRSRTVPPRRRRRDASAATDRTALSPPPARRRRLAESARRAFRAERTER